MQSSEPWFVARDVCECLELGNPRTSIALLDEDEKGVHTMDTPGGQQEQTPGGLFYSGTHSLERVSVLLASSFSYWRRDARNIPAGDA